MIVNIFLKTLNREEYEFYKSISKLDKVVNYAFKELPNSTDSILINSDAVEKRVLDDVNKATSIIIWGSDIVELFDNPIFRTIAERNRVYYSAIDNFDYVDLLSLRETLPQKYALTIRKFISKVIISDDMYTLNAFEIRNKPEEDVFLEGIKEVLNNIKMIRTMAAALFIQETLSTTLGVGWHIVRDTIFFITYTLFMISIRGMGEIDGLPSVLYLITGLAAWYCIGDIMVVGVSCLNKAKGIITKVKFPIVIIPFYTTLSIFYRRIITYIIVFTLIIISMLMMRDPVVFNAITFIYYTFAIFVFGAAFILITSSFVAISKDFHQLYKAFVRVQMYFNPVFWDVTSIRNMLATKSIPWIGTADTIFSISLYNPTVYLLNGYRASFGGTVNNDTSHAIVFWVIILMMFVLGFNIQSKLRGLYADII